MAGLSVSSRRASPVDYGDVQGLVRFGYKRMTEACYYLLVIKSPAAARLWLGTAPVASAVTIAPPPPAAAHVAFTAPGLQILGVPADVIVQFSAEFLSGMAGTENRSRRLGDVGRSAPSRWRWGRGDRLPHLIVMLFAEPGGLPLFRQRVLDRAWNGAFDVLDCLDTSNLNGVEQFGFTDGISQPVPDWDRTRTAGAGQIEYSNIVSLGEFLLGFPNEYGKYTDRPLVAPIGTGELLPPAEDVPSKRDLGRHGTYLVLRDLRQDVRGFWQFIHEQAERLQLERDRLGAAFVGRTRSGEPLVPVTARPLPGIGNSPDAASNRFTFGADAGGTQCPFGAHIRRANPRNADFPDAPRGVLARLRDMLGLRRDAFRDDLLSSVRFHRIIRRGREYGPGLSPDDAVRPAPPDDPERGLRFACINASIERQFEFLQNAWLMNTKFNGLTDEQDALLGNREGIAGTPAHFFTIPKPHAARCRIAGLPQFITVQGGAYFFLPGLRALRYIAEVGASSSS
jgi:deferrochelatase/peroxidase EfeB